MLSRIENLLRRRMGLDAASVGSSVIERTVRLRQKTRGLKTLAEYADLLETSAEEFNDLIESVVVTETWFFRDPEAFATLARLVRDKIRETSEQKSDKFQVSSVQAGHFKLNTEPSILPIVRILSLPCSTGEEPYSIAMTLLDAGVPPERFEVWAVDISTQALLRARRGVYGKNSFRSKNLEFRDRYFQATKEGHLLNETARARVRFEGGNLLDEKWRGPGGRPGGHYDYIFCRNLLIYFDRGTQEKAVKRLQKLLTPAGVCFVGAAELPLAVQNGFETANLPMAFACRLKGSAGSRSAGRNSESGAPRSPLRAPSRPAGALVATPARIPVAATKIQTPAIPSAERGMRNSALRAPHSAFEQATQLANQGKLNEAATFCRAHLDEHGPHAGTYYLLGLVHDARGEAGRAEDCYRKALYLEPNHYEALVQLALQKERNGDAEGARVLRQRARRTGKTNGIES